MSRKRLTQSEYFKCCDWLKANMDDLPSGVSRKDLAELFLNHLNIHSNTTTAALMAKEVGFKMLAHGERKGTIVDRLKNLECRVEALEVTGQMVEQKEEYFRDVG